MQSADEITQGQWHQQDCDRAALVWYIMLQINFIYMKKKKKKKKEKKRKPLAYIYMAGYNML
jgi:hypothetical protein